MHTKTETASLSFAILHVIQIHPNLKRITMTFSVPCHSCVQEVDSIHSAIERSLNKIKYLSPLLLLRLLLKVNTRNPYNIIQMEDCEFLDFQSYALTMNYKSVPFSKAVSREFSKIFYDISYKTSFTASKYELVSLHKRNGKQHITADCVEEIPLLLKNKNVCSFIDAK